MKNDDMIDEVLNDIGPIGAWEIGAMLVLGIIMVVTATGFLVVAYQLAIFIIQHV
jgi:hypothetical protein